MRVVATAGHVDHGKSSLVLALTGTDPDRFPEEKARGLTIDLGFAFTTLSSGETVGFVDVPGHVRFVKNMLAGVGAVEVAMLVVAANEGWMPQTEEHREILELLGVRHGLVVVTKIALVDDEVVELAHLEIAERLAGGPMSEWPVVTVDSPTARGIDNVRDALDRVLASAPPAPDLGRPRLWIDRSFSAKGAGAVVTGTLTGGALAVDDEVVVAPGQLRARVRSIEVNHEPQRFAPPGTRVALNVAGVDHGVLARGSAVVRDGQWANAAVVDVAVVPVDGSSLPRRATLRAHVGSGEHDVRVRVLDDAARFARLRFSEPLPLAPGDRLVLRSTGRRATVAGAEVLDVDPARRTADALTRLTSPLEVRILSARPWLTDDDLVVLAGVGAGQVEALAASMVGSGAAARVGTWLVARDALGAVVTRARDLVAAHHRMRPTSRGIDLASLASSLHLDVARARAALGAADDLVIDRDVVRHGEHATSALDHPDARRLLDALDGAPFSPPAPSDLAVAPDVVRDLVREGAVVDLDGVYLSAGALARARQTVAAAVLERGSLTVADVRDLLGSSRKFVLSIVNRLDAEGVTRRRGDARIAGPRAASVATGVAAGDG